VIFGAFRCDNVIEGQFKCLKAIEIENSVFRPFLLKYFFEAILSENSVFKLFWVKIVI